MTDPTITDSDTYVMVTLSGFGRRLVGGAGETRDVTPEAGKIRCVDAQTHAATTSATRRRT